MSSTLLLSAQHFRAFCLFGIYFSLDLDRASQVPLVVKSSPATAGAARDVGLIPGWGRYPGEGND